MNLKLHKQLMVSFFIVAVPLVAFGIVTILKNKYAKLPVYNNVELNGNANENEKVQHYIQPFDFINQEGNKFSSNELNNKIYVADFFFTSCLSICPQMTNNLKQVQNAF